VSTEDIAALLTQRYAQISEGVNKKYTEFSADILQNIRGWERGGGDAAERARRHELEHAMKLLARGGDPAKVLDALSHGITNKLLHAPTHALNQAEGAERAEVAALISRIYRLNSEE